MVSTRTTSNIGDQEGRDRQNPAQLQSTNQDAAGHTDQSGPVTRQEFQALLQELTQSRQQLTEQLRANAELTNQLNRQRRRRSRRDQAPHSSTESSASSDYNNRSTRPRLDENHAQATDYQQARTVGQV